MAETSEMNTQARDKAIAVLLLQCVGALAWWSQGPRFIAQCAQLLLLFPLARGFTHIAPVHPAV